MKAADIPELLSCFDDGTYGERDVLFLLAKLTAREDVDLILAALPEPWRRKFTTWMLDAYDNDEPASSFLMLDSAIGDVPEKTLIIERIRAWIEKHKARPAADRHK